MTSCVGAEGPPRTPKAAAGGTASPSPTPSATATATATSTGSVEDAVAVAGEAVRAAAAGRNAPGSQGLLVAAESTGGALFVWETADGRFCHGASGGMTMVACVSAPHRPPVGEKPRLVRLVAMMAVGWNVVFGAEHETVESVTCDGVPVPVKDVGVMADGRRRVHALAFPDLTVGTVDVRVRRGSRVVTESLTLMTPGKGDTAQVASCGKP
ncbi:hypothetical protein ABZ621_27290 [Streptomyces sp. NPDC007863]|uniref:hypothetical protein n=1 Tax=Streptomyces sp. NPDC007863 TaxID=3154894 RepID=UPI0033D529E7